MAEWGKIFRSEGGETWKTSRTSPMKSSIVDFGKIDAFEENLRIKESVKSVSSTPPF